MEPSATGPLWPKPSLFRREFWIEQPHGGVEMHETGTMVDDLLLQMTHHPAQLGSLPTQSVYDVGLSHRNSPSWIKVQDGNRTTPSLGTRAWWRLLHDTVKMAYYEASDPLVQLAGIRDSVPCDVGG
jgi:hypothetical protein